MCIQRFAVNVLVQVNPDFSSEIFVPITSCEVLGAQTQYFKCIPPLVSETYIFINA